MSAEIVNLRFGTGERDTMPVRVYRSRGVNYVVTRSWSHPEQFAVTQRASGRAAADGLTRRQAEIIAVVLDRILPSETLGGSRLVLTHLPKPLCVAGWRWRRRVSK